MKLPFLKGLVVAAVLSFAAVALAQAGHNGVKLNGSSLNGSSLNGSSLNGIKFNGVKLNGTGLNEGSVVVRGAILP